MAGSEGDVIEVDGHTPDGTHVRVVREGDHPLRVEVFIDGKSIGQVRRPELYRDGGTRRFYLERGDVLTFPHRLARPSDPHPTRTPTLNGEPIT